MPALDATTLLSSWEVAYSQPPAMRALTLLSAVYPGEEFARSAVGLRDRRLIELRERLFGNTMEGVARCPTCADRVEFAFSTADVRVQDGGVVEASTVVDGYAISMRAPASADLVAVSRATPGEARDALLRRCVRAKRNGADVDPVTLPGELQMRISGVMESLDPQADVHMHVACPSCGSEWDVPFDIVAFLWNELDDWAQRLVRDVHTLASAYGWSERDILGMSAWRRRMYLQYCGV